MNAVGVLVLLCFSSCIAADVTVWAGSGHAVGSAIVSDGVSFSQPGNRLLVVLNVPAVGTYPVSLYSSGANSRFNLFINGISNGTVNTNSDQVKMSLPLRTGLNSLRFVLVSGNRKFTKFVITGGLEVAARGATKPFVKYEAESASHNGKALAYSRKYKDLASEASGRRAVTLTNGQWIDFRLTDQASGLVLRYSIPDSANGKGRNTSITIITPQGRHTTPLSSKYAWVYGNFPFNNDPSKGNGHRFYDEVRVHLDYNLASGSVVRVDSSGASVPVTVDLLEGHRVNWPFAEPPNAVNVVSVYNADPSGQRDSTDAIQKALNDFSGKGRPVYLPPGEYKCSRTLSMNRVSLHGAGPWHTNLFSVNPFHHGFKLYGVKEVGIYDIKVTGASELRKDEEGEDVGAGGSVENSVLQNVWIERTKAGLWFSGPTSGLTLFDLEIRNTWADGVNLYRGVTNSVAMHLHVRNSGDDCFALWTPDIDDRDNAIIHNTFQLPMLANTLGIYGGSNVYVYSNHFLDTVYNGGGVNIGNRYGSTVLNGQIHIWDNTYERVGTYNDANLPGHNGAIWIGPQEKDMTADVVVSDSDIIDPLFAAITIGKGTVKNLQFKNIKMDKGEWFLEVTQAKGSAYFENCRADKVAQTGTATCSDANFAVNKGSGNVGWDQKKCMNW